LPNSANVEQTMIIYDIAGAFGDISVESAMERSNIVSLSINITI